MARFLGLEPGELHAGPKHQRQVAEREHLDMVATDVPGGEVLGQQVTHALGVVRRIGDNQVAQHPAVDDRASGGFQEAGWAEHGKDQGGAELGFAVALLVQAPQPCGKEAVKGLRLLAVLVIKALEVEAQVPLPHPADGELERLRAFLDGPPRTKRRETLEHVILEVVGVHRRLLAHCFGCNGGRYAGLQDGERGADAP